jgi:hypothetical protein
VHGLLSDQLRFNRKDLLREIRVVPVCDTARLQIKSFCSVKIAMSFKGNHFTQREKQFILNASNFFEKEKKEGTHFAAKNVAKRTSACLGVSEVSVKRVRSEKVNCGELSEPEHRDNAGRRIVVDEFFQGVIRRTVHSFYERKEYPTVDMIFSKVKGDCSDFPLMGKTTFRKILSELGFQYRTFKSKPILMESPEVVSDRCRFIREIRYYRRLGWKVYYTDETWCGANHCIRRGWQEAVSTDNGSDAYDQHRGSVQSTNGWKGGIKIPSGAGKRLIICHIGDEDGFLPGEGIELCFIGQKGAADYHKEMNAQHYEEWFKKVLEAIPDKSAIVIDQAPYHTMIVEETKPPSMAWSKPKLVEWAYSRSVPMPDYAPYPEHLTKEELVQLSKPFAVPKRKVLDDAVQKCGKQIKLIWVPVAHCELNAIELIWANVKGFVAKHNTTFKIKDVEELCRQSLRQITPNVWKNATRHVKKIEDDYAERHHVIEAQIDPVIVHLNAKEDSTSDSDSESDSSD